jgi:hypothetical protein
VTASSVVELQRKGRRSRCALGEGVGDDAVELTHERAGAGGAESLKRFHASACRSNGST